MTRIASWTCTMTCDLVAYTSILTNSVFHTTFSFVLTIFTVCEFQTLAAAIEKVCQSGLFNSGVKYQKYAVRQLF